MSTQEATLLEHTLEPKVGLSLCRHDDTKHKRGGTTQQIFRSTGSRSAQNMTSSQQLKSTKMTLAATGTPHSKRVLRHATSSTNAAASLKRYVTLSYVLRASYMLSIPFRSLSVSLNVSNRYNFLHNLLTSSCFKYSLYLPVLSVKFSRIGLLQKLCRKTTVYDIL